MTMAKNSAKAEELIVVSMFGLCLGKGFVSG